MESETQLRDRLAVDRTHLANERTLLAYVRTGLALMLAGAGLLQFASLPAARAPGVLLLAAGLLSLPFGAWRFLRIRARIRDRGSPESGG